MDRNVRRAAGIAAAAVIGLSLVAGIEIGRAHV